MRLAPYRRRLPAETPTRRRRSGRDGHRLRRSFRVVRRLRRRRQRGGRFRELRRGRRNAALGGPSRRTGRGVGRGRAGNRGRLGPRHDVGRSCFRRSHGSRGDLRRPGSRSGVGGRRACVPGRLPGGRGVGGLSVGRRRRLDPRRSAEGRSRLDRRRSVVGGRCSPDHRRGPNGRRSLHRGRSPDRRRSLHRRRSDDRSRGGSGGSFNGLGRRGITGPLGASRGRTGIARALAASRGRTGIAVILLGRRCRRRLLRWCGCRLRHRSRRRQHRERVEIAARVCRQTNPQVDVRAVDLGAAGGPDRSDHGALGDGRSAGDSERAEVRQRHRETVFRLDRHGQPVRRNGAGERHASGGGRDDRSAVGRPEVDPAMLPSRVRVRRVERELLDDGPVHGPRPGVRGRHPEHEEEDDRKQATHRGTTTFVVSSVNQESEGSNWSGRCQS